MILERQLEEAFITTLSAMSELSCAQIVGSRTVAPQGETKEEEDTAKTVVAVACGFRQNDAFSLTPITVPLSISISTRVELDTNSEEHDRIVEAVANLLSRWHKFGNEMSEALTSDKFFAGELRMDGGTARVFDTTNATWYETISFSIRGSEKFVAPEQLFPKQQGLAFSDGTFLPVADIVFQQSSPYALNQLLSLSGKNKADIVSVVAYVLMGGGMEGTADNAKSVYVAQSCSWLPANYFTNATKIEKVVFKDRTMDEIQQMYLYPWGLTDLSKIQVI